MVGLHPKHEDGIPLRRDWLAEAPFTLLLGAGFFGFFSHAGLLAALEEAGLRPRRVVGVSAGALAGGLWASGLGAEVLTAELLRLRRADFWDPGLPLGGLLRGRKFGEKLRALLHTTGVRVVEECPTPFAAVSHDLRGRRTHVMDTGPLDVAIQASCSVPFMFRPVVTEGRVLVDGGVSDRSGFSALRPRERVLFHALPSRRRLRLGAAPVLPDRVPGCDALVLVTPDLPRVTPFRLHEGPVAMARTRAHVRAWLNAPMLVATDESRGAQSSLPPE